MLGSNDAALVRVQRDLAEVLDECKYLESQCEEKDRSLEHVTLTTQRRERYFLEALHSALNYLIVIEQSVLFPAFGDVLSFVRKYSPLTQARDNMLQRTAAGLQGAQHAQLSKILSLLHSPPAESARDNVRYETFHRVSVQLDDAYIALSQLSKNYERLVSALSLVHTYTAEIAPPSVPSTKDAFALQRRVDELTLERDSIRQDMERAAAHDKKMLAARFETILRAAEKAAMEKNLLQEELNALQRNYAATESALDQARALQQEREDIHRLRIELEQIKRENATKLSRLEEDNVMLRAQLNTGSMAPEVATAMRLQISQLQEQNDKLRDENSKLRAQIIHIERTVDTMNTELRDGESRIAELQREHNDQRRQWIEDTEKERIEYQGERMECDLIVHKLTEELETLIKENKDLREREQRGSVVWRNRGL